MSTFALWRLFHRPGTRGLSGHTSLLATVAFAAATGIFLTVLGGVHGFVWRASADHTVACFLDARRCAPGADAVAYWAQTFPDAALADGGTSLADNMAGMAGGYVFLAAVACLLLVVPFAALAGSAARLAASRRDARLAALRLVGATRGQVVRLTALDAAGQAVLGALIGVLLYLALMPAIMLLNFQNLHFTFEQLWVGPLALVATVAGVAALALASALLTLRRVSITPLGVAARASQPLPAAWRVAAFVGAMIAALATFKLLPQLGASLGEAAMIAISLGFMLLPFLLMNLVGSWAVAARARARARRPRTAAVMIGMRRILDDPKRAWRNVSGIALAMFIAGFTSVAGYAGTGGGAPADAAAATDPAVIFARDIGTGGLLTLAFAAVLAAVSSGVMQAGSVYDQADEYRMLVLEGTDVATLARARFAEVMTPLNVVTLLAGGCSMLLMLPLFGQAMGAASTLLGFLGGVGLCYALVAVGAFAANRAAASLSLVDRRTDD
ncbi:FtsX-like permease family protein [Bifidobacterium avesanii]|uniref:FtsX-like permease family protein n=1 Tax=Bifidobacterium avesanii TaxID=1798157 RepID=A0A7K3TIQ0_9BIFI|nr:FtsX-like permease family protein [Bifidobacterium avesanii]KAB8290341.1 ABC transporter permease [Bifidobacterium avesanii]NEG78985.1 FtsX-like permease family protein [Bifidobacterium avesanii]